MRDVLDDLLGWWRDGRSVAMATVIAHLAQRPPPGRARPCSSGRTAPPSAASPAAVSRARCTSWARRCSATGQPVLSATGSPTTTRSRSGSPAAASSTLRGAVSTGDRSRNSATSRPRSRAERAGRGGHGRRRARPTRSGGGWSCGRTGVPARSGSARLDDAVTDDVRGMLASGRTGTLRYGRDGERRGEGLAVFVASFAPPPRMLVFGAIDFAAAVARIGAFLGYRVTVCDARPVFATAAPVPGRRRGRGRLAAPVPGGRGGRGPGGRADGDLRAHPRPEVRRARAGGGAGAAGGVRRGDGVAAHPR